MVKYCHGAAMKVKLSREFFVAVLINKDKIKAREKEKEKENAM